MTKRKKNNKANNDLQNTTQKTKRLCNTNTIQKYVNSGTLEICFINHGSHCLGDRNEDICRS